MKKPLLVFGTTLAIAAPVVGVVSCTLVKEDHIKDYVEVKTFESMSDINDSFDVINVKDSTNFGVTPWIKTFADDTDNNILGVLKTKTNNKGIIATPDFTKNDLEALTRFFEALTWNEYGNNTVRVLNEDRVRIASPINPDAKLGVHNVELKSHKIPNGVKILQDISLSFGEPIFPDDKLHLFDKKTIKEFEPWHTSATEDVFKGNNIKYNENEKEDAINQLSLGSNAHLLEFMRKTVQRLDYTVATPPPGIVSPNYNKFDFNQNTPTSKPITFYLYDDVNFENELFKHTNGLDGINNLILNRRIYADTIEKEFAHLGLKIDIKFVGNGNGNELNPKTGKNYTLSELSNIANNDKLSLVYMPVDNWLESKDLKGSLFFQKRTPKTIGAATLDDVSKDDYEINETKVYEQLANIGAIFPEFFDGQDSFNGSIAKFLELASTLTTLHDVYIFAKDANGHISSRHRLLPSAEEMDRIQKIKLGARGYFNQYADYPRISDQQIAPANKFESMYGTYVNNSLSLPKVNTGHNSKIIYKDDSMYSTMSVDYIYAPHKILDNDILKRFSDKLGTNGPKVENHYEWEINVRDELPLPIRVGALSQTISNQEDAIDKWIEEHFIV